MFIISGILFFSRCIWARIWSCHSSWSEFCRVSDVWSHETVHKRSQNSIQVIPSFPSPQSISFDSPSSQLGKTVGCWIASHPTWRWSIFGSLGVRLYLFREYYLTSDPLHKPHSEITKSLLSALVVMSRGQCLKLIPEARSSQCWKLHLKLAFTLKSSTDGRHKRDLQFVEESSLHTKGTRSFQMSTCDVGLLRSLYTTIVLVLYYCSGRCSPWRTFFYSLFGRETFSHRPSSFSHSRAMCPTIAG